MSNFLSKLTFTLNITKSVPTTKILFCRYNQRYVDQAAVAAQLAQAKYVSGASQYGTSSTLRRNRGSLDYSSDTEATSGSRSGYYYYR